MPSDSALLIGVNDYSTYDASAGLPPATSQLTGSLNDVRAWLSLCREIGITSVRVLTSPALPADEQIEGVDYRSASAQEIRDGVAWLAGQLGGSAPADEAPVGLLVFSGHGDQTANEGLVLCPTDTAAAGDELTGVVALDEIERTLAAANAERNLTVVLDCCHDGGRTFVQGAQPTVLRAARPALAASPPRPRIGERMLCAATLGQPAFQAQFGADATVAHGAFTWAFMTTKNRWTLNPQGDTLELSLSYQRMRDATRDLLRSLDFAQCPELDCQPGAASLPVFHRGLIARPGATSPSPNQSSPCKQCDPGFSDYRLYSFWQVNVLVGQMLVPANNNNPSFSTLYEYWYMVSLPSGRAQTTVTMADYAWSTATPARALSFRMLQAPTWTPTPPTSTRLLVNATSTIGIQWLLTQSAGGWGGSIVWSQSTPSGNPNTLFAGPPATQIFSLVSSVPGPLATHVSVPTI